MACYVDEYDAILCLIIVDYICVMHRVFYHAPNKATPVRVSVALSTKRVQINHWLAPKDE